MPSSMFGVLCQSFVSAYAAAEPLQQLSLRKFPLASRLMVVPPAETTHGEEEGH
jgi:hypothetical protein